MKRHLLLVLALAFLTGLSHAAEPLRVFIRGGKKSHGPNAHEHERFLNDWKKLLAERGAKVDGALSWPSAEQFAQTDVIVAYAQEGGDATPEQERLIEAFVKRGGGLVVIHTASVSMKNPAWWKGIIGGAWKPGTTKWKEGPMDLYYVENQRIGEQHPITKGASNFHIDDEIYYDMDISPDVRVLATSYTPNVPAGKKVAEGGKVNVHDIQPQMWTYEKAVTQASRLSGPPPSSLQTAGGPTGGTPVLQPQTYRAFVSIPGHLYFTFEKPHYRAILLRGIAWAGQRDNIDEFVKKEEVEALTYPEGGPQRPADTLKALEIHPDFTLKLVAAEPLINKPMNFDWDPAGRLWVAETPEYPNGRRGMRPDYRGKEWKDHGGIDPAPGAQERPAHDKISILTDTDGDGVMDKKDVFYEGLDLVTGLVFHRDGVIVTQAPDILWLRDTDGDGKADKVEKLYTGLGTIDTHAVINNPRWGWDGWIYATHGYSGSDKVLNAKGETQGGIGSGVVRFLPDGSKIEQYSSKGGNTWGLTITGDNRVMWTQPTSGELLMHTVLPEYALARGKVGKTPSYKVVEPSGKAFPAIDYDRLPYVQIDWVGSFTASAGAVIYDGGAWPEEYNGDYFTTEPTINIIHHQRLKPAGSSYEAHRLPGREQTEFIRSKDMWWRPIEVRVGPDGAVYIADFYNQAVIHNDTRGPDHNKVNAAVRPDRDHYFGRIWKIEHKQAKKLEVPDLSKANAEALAKALEHPSRAVRMTAARLLTERTLPVTTIRVSYLSTEAERKRDLAAQRKKNFDKSFAGSALERIILDKAKPVESRIAALWVYSWFAPESEHLRAGMSDESPELRRNAALICDSTADLPVLRALIKLLSDENAAVRLAALLGLINCPEEYKDAADGGKLVPIGEIASRAIVAAWPKLSDDFQRSAAVGAAAQNPAASIAAALDLLSAGAPAESPPANSSPGAATPVVEPKTTPTGSASLAPLVIQLTQIIGEKTTLPRRRSSSSRSPTSPRALTR